MWVHAVWVAINIGATIPGFLPGVATVAWRQDAWPMICELLTFTLRTHV